MKKHLLIVSTCLLSVATYAQWTPQATAFSAASRGIQKVCAVDANTVWVAAYDGSGGNDTVQDFSRTIDGGTTWTAGTIPAPSYYSFSDLFAVNATTAWAMFWDEKAGTGGGVWKTTDGGTTWAQQGSGTIFDANSFPDFIYFATATVGIAVGDPNPDYFEIYNTLDGGTTWTRVPKANIPAPLSGEYGYLHGYAVAGTTMWFITNKGRVFKSVNGGVNWTATATGLADVTYIAMTSANDGIVAMVPQTGAATLKKTNDGGATWTAVTVSSGTFFTADLKAIPGSNIYVSTGANTATAIGSSYSVDQGTNWVKIDTSAQHTAQGWVNASTGWCGGFTTNATTGGIFKYTGGVVGVAALNNDHARMRLFPNPSHGQFTLQIGGAEANDATLKITDIVGNTVYENRVENNSSVIEKNIVLSGITKGVYFVTVENGATRFVNKLIIE